MDGGPATHHGERTGKFGTAVKTHQIIKVFEWFFLQQCQVVWDGWRTRLARAWAGERSGGVKRKRADSGETICP